MWNRNWNLKNHQLAISWGCPFPRSDLAGVLIIFRNNSHNHGKKRELEWTCVAGKFRKKFPWNSKINLFFSSQVFISVILLFPCGGGVFYFLALQTHKLKLEIILCALMFLLHLTELFFAFMFLFTMCRPPTYT